VLLFLMFLRSDTIDGRNDGDEDEGGGGGGSDRISDRPKTSPSGGIPLPDAEPAPCGCAGTSGSPTCAPRPERRRVHRAGPGAPPRAEPLVARVPPAQNWAVRANHCRTSSQAGLRTMPS
jgi:hypothetical protein